MIITLLYAYMYVICRSIITMVEPRLCEQPSGTWSRICRNNNACKNQCVRLEGAQRGSCNYVIPAHKL
ncbi:hypothetical protein AQUCO_18900001v1 [Aquilegia coerulea]|uniref:Knottins-like domain-containing protein n=1 Tax=Aquilegia coerulea TaxID=218851 RepID=A0A2G5C0Q7_AQUCA|nr:hypothetical protein AQUCO_18900001v1 [Aquilegia coerulea]